MASCSLPLSSHKSAVTFLNRPTPELAEVFELAPAIGLVLELTSVGLLLCLDPLMTRPILVLKLKPVLALLVALPLFLESGLAGVGPRTLPNPRRAASPPKVVVPITDCGRADERSECSGKVGMLFEPLIPGMVYPVAEEGREGKEDVGVVGLAVLITEIRE